MRREDELHQRAEGRVTDITNFFNITNRNYPPVEATKLGLKTAALNREDPKAYKKAYIEEKSKEVGIKNEEEGPDFSDLGIGE